MKQQDFEQHYEGLWLRMETLLQAGQKQRKKKEQQAYDYALLPSDYRRLCHCLALAKHRGYSPYLVDRLNRLVLACHNLLYSQSPRFRYQWLRFFAADFPLVLYKNRYYHGVAALLFVLPLLVLGVLCYLDAEMIYALMDWQEVMRLEQMYDPAARVWGRERAADTDLYMFGYYIFNNIGIGFREFAGGLFFGLYTIFILLLNGVFIGAAAGHLTQLGYHSTFYPFVIGHGAFELTGLVLCGGAGLKIGMALIDPGQQSRTRALREASREAVQIVLGAAVMLLIAAFIEAFWSSKASVPVSIKLAVGSVLWVLVFTYLYCAGRVYRRMAADGP